MQTLAQIIIANPDATDAGIAALFNAQPAEAKPSSPSTYVTYLSIGEDVTRFGPGAVNFAGRIRTSLKAWAAGVDLSGGDPASPLPNPGVFESVADRLAGAKGVDLSSPTAPGLIGLFAAGVPGLYDPIITAEQAAALLSIGYTIVTPVGAAAVRLERFRLARLAADDAVAVAFDADPAAPAATLAAIYSAELIAKMGGAE